MANKSGWKRYEGWNDTAATQNIGVVGNGFHKALTNRFSDHAGRSKSEKPRKQSRLPDPACHGQVLHAQVFKPFYDQRDALGNRPAGAPLVKSNPEGQSAPALKRNGSTKVPSETPAGLHTARTRQCRRIERLTPNNKALNAVVAASALGGNPEAKLSHIFAGSKEVPAKSYAGYAGLESGTTKLQQNRSVPRIGANQVGGTMGVPAGISTKALDSASLILPNGATTRRMMKSCSERQHCKAVSQVTKTSSERQHCEAFDFKPVKREASSAEADTSTVCTRSKATTASKTSTTSEANVN